MPGLGCALTVCVVLAPQACFLATIGANEAVQKQDKTARLEKAQQPYPDVLQQITATVGGVVQWDGKKGYTVAESIKERVHYDLVRRATEVIIRTIRNHIAPVCHTADRTYQNLVRPVAGPSR